MKCGVPVNSCSGMIHNHIQTIRIWQYLSRIINTFPPTLNTTGSLLLILRFHGRISLSSYGRSNALYHDDMRSDETACGKSLFGKGEVKE